jgi:hypothetical protein
VSSAKGAADAVDGLSAGLLLVDGSARIIRVNVAGQAMLDRGSVLHSPNGKLVAADPNAARICHDRG